MQHFDMDFYNSLMFLLDFVIFQQMQSCCSSGRIVFTKMHYRRLFLCDNFIN